jgi:hypothetical protein
MSTTRSPNSMHYSTPDYLTYQYQGGGCGCAQHSENTSSLLSVASRGPQLLPRNTNVKKTSICTTYKSINVIQAAELDTDGLSESSANCGTNDSCTAATCPDLTCVTLTARSRSQNVERRSQTVSQTHFTDSRLHKSPRWGKQSASG